MSRINISDRQSDVNNIYLTMMRECYKRKFEVLTDENITIKQKEFMIDSIKLEQLSYIDKAKKTYDNQVIDHLLKEESKLLIERLEKRYLNEKK